MKTMMNKVMATMIMVLTAAAPAMASGNSHFKTDKKVGHFDTRRAYHPDMKICNIKVSRHDSPSKIMARAERIHGVKDAKYNPRTRTVSVLYDANRTTSKKIRKYFG